MVAAVRKACLSNGSRNFGQIFDRLEALLGDRGGYDDLGIFRTPSGFAIATQFERIRQDGSIADPQKRWDTKPFSNGFWQIISNQAEPGRYRSFLLSYGKGLPQAINVQPFATTIAEFKPLGLSLSAADRKRIGGADYYLQVFVYVYERQAIGSPAILVPIGSSAPHFNKSHLSQVFQMMCN